MPSTDRDLRAQKVNRWAAVIIPLILIGIVAWATYVVIVKVAVDVYLKTKDNTGAGIAIIVLYSIILFLTALCYFRLLVTIWYNPGYMPRLRDSASASPTNSGTSPLLASKHAQAGGGGGGGGGHKQQQEQDAGQLGPGPVPDYSNGTGGSFSEDRLAAKLRNLDSFRPKEVFLVDGDGLPRWCMECETWKPDRTHHCSDLGRCVRRFDHFCPWVGGIVSETTMKFFLQFTFYASSLSLFVLIVTAIYLKDTKRDAQIIAMVAVSALFVLFAVGIFGNTFFMTCHNYTTVESLGKSQSHTFAVRITPEWYPYDTSGPQKPFPFDVKKFPGAPDSLYAIISTGPSENPWDIGGWANVRSVMGRVRDWWLPFRYSPCTNHEREESDYPVGKALERVKRDMLTAIQH